jgi:hypothetical protein
LWSLSKAPARYRNLFPEGKELDWIASVPAPLATITETQFLRWRQLYPVSSAQLRDGSIVYWGAPRESIPRLAELYSPATDTIPPPAERRSGVRIPMACAARYQTSSRTHPVSGECRIIDLSSSGAAFTTKALPNHGARVALFIPWPVKLLGNLEVEFHATGKIVRRDSKREPKKVALKYDRLNFSVAAS